MKLRSVAILYNPHKPHAMAIQKQMAAYLRAQGVNVRPPSGAQILITIGGDGTILFNKTRHLRPYWAIGSDTSFLCQSHQSSWKKDIARLIARGFSAEKRLMLHATLNGFSIPDALNEVVVRSQYHRVLDLELTIGRKRQWLQADGLIFSTPTGSSAYAYSAGGKEMKPTARRWQVVAIAPYRRLFKPMMLGPNQVCKVRVVGLAKADAVVDGQMHKPIRGGSELVVRASPHAFEFVRLKK